MAFLSKLLGRRTPEEERAEANRLFDAREFGRAKLVYERFLDKLDKGDPAREDLNARIGSCRDGIAEERLREARLFLETRQNDLARTELLGALEIAAGEHVRGEAQGMLDAMEQQDAVTTAAAPADITREEQVALLAATWEEEQEEEYGRYGAALEDALLALNAEDSENALTALEALLATARDPRYLHFEIGRARLMQGLVESGEEALRTFLARIGP